MEYSLWKHAKRRAKAQGVPFDLAVEDIHVPDSCPVLGLTLRRNVGRIGLNSPTLDKVIPAFGYVKGNVNVISMKANRTKGDCSIEQLERLVAYMRNAAVNTLLAGRGLRHEGGSDAFSEIAT